MRWKHIDLSRHRYPSKKKLFSHFLFIFSHKVSNQDQGEKLNLGRKLSRRDDDDFFKERRFECRHLFSFLVGGQTKKIDSRFIVHDRVWWSVHKTQAFFYIYYDMIRISYKLAFVTRKFDGRSSRLKLRGKKNFPSGRKSFSSPVLASSFLDLDTEERIKTETILAKNEMCDRLVCVCEY